jgi:hypothetical protein
MQLFIGTAHMCDDRELVVTLVKQHWVMGRHEFAVGTTDDRCPWVLSDKGPDDSKIRRCVMGVMAHHLIVSNRSAGQGTRRPRPMNRSRAKGSNTPPAIHASEADPLRRLVRGQKAAPGLPFGGFKQSGWGRENGRIGIEAYTEIKSVAIAL